MPEIIIPGIKEVGNGASEAQAQMLQKLRQEQRMQLWTEAGTEAECEDSWRKFLLAGTPDWVIYS